MTFTAPGGDLSLPDTLQLDRSLVSGIGWTVVLRMASRAFGWASMLYVVRILTPADFGLMAMASMPMGLAQMVGDFGLQTVVVQDRTLRGDRLASVATLALGLGALFTVSFLALSKPIAAIFREPAVALIVTVLSVTFLIDSIQLLPRALLQRDLAFRTLAWVQTVQLVVGAAVQAICATLSFGYWALVITALASSVTASAVLFALRPFRLGRPTRVLTVFPAFAAGWRVTVARVAWYAYTSLDATLIGRMIGKDALGVFNMAKTFASVPDTEIAAMVSRVAPGIFSSVQTSVPMLRRYFLILTEGIAYLTLPGCIGLAVVADDFVRLVLGPTWLSAILPLRILAVYVACSTSQMLISHVLIFTGQMRANMWVNLFSLAFMPMCFYIGVFEGVPGVAWAWLIGFPVIIALKIIIVRPLLDLTLADYIWALRPAFIASVALGAAVLLVRTGLPLSWSPAARLAVEGTAGVLTYAVILVSLFRPRVVRIYQAIRQAARSPVKEPGVVSAA